MNSRKSFHREVKMMIAGGFTCQRYGFNVGADKFSLLTIENGKTSIMRLSEWTLISQSQKSHSDRLLDFLFLYFVTWQRDYHDHASSVIVLSRRSCSCRGTREKKSSPVSFSTASTVTAKSCRGRVLPLFGMIKPIIFCGGVRS